MSAAEFISQKSQKGVDMETIKQMIHNFGNKDFKILKLEKCEEQKSSIKIYRKGSSKNSE